MERIIIRLAYFGYEATLEVAPGSSAAERRAAANEHILTVYGDRPTWDYVEPNLPFPDYVPVQVWDYQDGMFY